MPSNKFTIWNSLVAQNRKQLYQSSAKKYIGKFRQFLKSMASGRTGTRETPGISVRWTVFLRDTAVRMTQLQSPAAH